jgi:hypothetical protein
MSRIRLAGRTSRFPKRVSHSWPTGQRSHARATSAAAHAGTASNMRARRQGPCPLNWRRDRSVVRGPGLTDGGWLHGKQQRHEGHRNDA